MVLILFYYNNPAVHYPGTFSLLFFLTYYDSGLEIVNNRNVAILISLNFLSYSSNSKFSFLKMFTFVLILMLRQLKKASNINSIDAAFQLCRH